MPSILNNKFVRFGLFGLGIVVVIVVLFFAWLMMSVSSTGLSSKSISMGLEAPMMYEAGGVAMDRGYATEEAMYAPNTMPVPQPDGYVANLESYETTDYRLTARTRQFTEFCATLKALKADERFDFRNLNQNTNNCSATFYTAEQYADEALSRLQQFSGVEVTRNTVSVTRQKEQLQSRTDILRQQLQSVERTLASAETQFDEIIAIARASNNASELSSAITEKLRMIDSLTQRKISLSSQINNALRQAQDLDERIGVIQFSVSAQPLIYVHPNQTERQWQEAWKELKDRFTETLIGLSAFLGVFLLFVLQGIVYLLIVIVLVRLLWKFARLVWRKL